MVIKRRVSLVLGLAVIMTVFTVTWMQTRPGPPVEPAAISALPDEPRQESVVEKERKPPVARPDTEEIVKRIVEPHIRPKSEGAKRTAQLSTGLENYLHDIKGLLSQAKNAHADQLPDLLQLLESKLPALLAIEKEAQSWLEDKAYSNTPLAEQVAKRFEKTYGVINAAINASEVDRTQAIAQAITTLERYSRPEYIAPKQPTHSVVKPREYKREDFQIAPPPAYARRQNITQSVIKEQNSEEKKGLVNVGEELLNMMGIKSAHAEPPSEPAKQFCGHTTEDVSSALPEVEINHPEIKSLAKKLEYSPIKIYSYVYNNIDFRLYDGSVKGALGTLKSGSGNATDQASLLIALLRASNIPARYVKGPIEPDEKELFNWLGVKTVMAASVRLFVKRIPAFTPIFGHESVEIVHVWVEACVPYDNYRGSVTDQSGYHWIPLDPSFKEMTYTEGTITSDISDFVFDEESYLSKRTNVLPQDALQDQMEAELGKALEHGGGYRGKIVKRKIDILPSTLPYRVNGFYRWEGMEVSEVSQIPEQHRWYAHFDLYGKGYRTKWNANEGKVWYEVNSNTYELMPTLTIDLPSLYSERLTLSFEPMHDPSQTARMNEHVLRETPPHIDNWKFNDGDLCGFKPFGYSDFWNPDKQPSNFRVGPVFKLNGSDVNPTEFPKTVQLCSHLYTNVALTNLRISIKQGSRSEGGARFIDVNEIRPYEFYTISVTPFGISDGLIEERVAELVKTVGENSEANPNLTQDATLGEYLHIAGLKYTKYADEAGRKIGSLYGRVSDQKFTSVVLSTVMKVAYLFDIPLAVIPYGALKIDAHRSDSYHFDIFAQNDHSSFVVDNVSEVAGWASSLYESHIWQEIAHMDAISTTRGIQYANETGMPVVNVTTPADIDEHLNKSCADYGGVDYSESFLSRLKYSIDRGVKIPTCQIRYKNWLGAVYSRKIDGDGIYHIIEGGYVANGGQTVSKILIDDITLDTDDSTLDTDDSTLVIDDVPDTFGQNEPGFTIPPSFTLDIDPDQGTGYVGELNDSVLAGDIWGDHTLNLSVNGVGSDTGALDLSTFAGDPVNLVSGNFYHSEIDITLKGRGGLNFVFERTYNSHMRKDGPLGYGWTHSFNHQLSFHDTDGNDKTDQVVWVDGRGSVMRFTNADPGGGILLGEVLSNQDGLYVTAKREMSGEYSIRQKNGATFYFQNMTGQAGQVSKLIRVVDRNSNTLTMSYGDGKLSGVTDDLNRGLTFHYDNNDHHITRITDWSDRAYRYTYVNNNLDSFEPPVAVSGLEYPTKYTYYTSADYKKLDHVLKSFVRPNGDSMEFEYYSNGRVFRHTDESGQQYTFRYNPLRRETTTVDERGVSQTYLFNKHGQQVRHTQGDGSRLKYEYLDEKNQLFKTASRNALGYQTKYQYSDDGNGNLLTTTYPDESTLEFRGHNAFNFPCSTKDQNGHYTLNRYDAQGNITDIIMLNSGVELSATEADSCAYLPVSSDILAWTINTYDTYGNLKVSKRVRNFESKAGPYVEYIYDDDNLHPTTVKRCGLQQAQDDVGELVHRCVSATQSFDLLGRLTQGLTNTYYTTRIEYDENGRITRATDATNQWRDYRYDNNGNLKSEDLTGLNSNGKVDLFFHTSINYDDLNRPVISRNKAGYSTHTEYDEIGNIVEVTNPDGYSIRFEYDEQSRPIRAFDEHGYEVVTQYDIGGRPIKVTDANGNSTEYDYYGAEKNGRLKTIVSADNTSLTYHYDDNGNIIRTVDNDDRKNLIFYDALNRPVRTVGPLHKHHDSTTDIRQVIKSTYNELGYVTLVEAGYTTDVTGGDGSDLLTIQASYGYDDFGRVISEEDGNGKVTKHFYDNHGNRTKTIQANGHVVELEYDHDRHGLIKSRIAKLSETDSDSDALITSYSYNPLGQLIYITAPEGDYFYQYDEASRLESVVDTNSRKKLTYDLSPGGLLNSIIDSDGKRSDYLYDAASRLTAIEAPNGERVNFIFDAGGRLLETKMDNGVSARYSYDRGNKLKKVTNNTRQGMIATYEYGYDELGRRDSQYVHVRGTSPKYYVYAYDELNRLEGVYEDLSRGVEWAQALQVKELYTYDVYGNRRTHFPGLGGATDYYIYDDAHQLDEIRAASATGELRASFDYDDSGNLKTKSKGGVIQTMDYDALDRLVEVKENNLTMEKYTYDHEGRRISKTTGDHTANYLYSGLNIWAEYDVGWGSAMAYYTYTGLDKPIIRSAGNPAGRFYYHHDGLGSVTSTSNIVGSMTARISYDAWGNVIASGGIKPQYGYTGRESDATGLIYYRARYYDPTIARFTQRDPIGFGGGLNPYAYVGNSPLDFVDPFGLAAADAWQISNQDFLPDYSLSIDLDNPTAVNSNFSSPISSDGWGGTGLPQGSRVITNPISDYLNENPCVQWSGEACFANNFVDSLQGVSVAVSKVFPVTEPWFQAGNMIIDSLQLSANGDPIDAYRVLAPAIDYATKDTTISWGSHIMSAIDNAPKIWSYMMPSENAVPFNATKYSGGPYRDQVIK